MIDELITEEEAPRTDFYLKLDAEADMPTVLSAFYKQDYTTIVDPETFEESTQLEGEPYFVANTSDYSIDVVGVLHEPTGNTLTYANGLEYPEMVALDGWHVNIRLTGDVLRDETEALDVSHGVIPSAPKRVWL
jgi:hypothetical protein